MNVRNANPNIICVSNNCKFLTVGETLATTRSKRLQIPTFQRRYCWGRQVLKKFLEDVNNHATRSSVGTFRPHSFGRIVTTERGNQILVVDGQQRLTTINLLLASIRDVVQKHDKSVESLALQTEINDILFQKVVKQKSGSDAKMMRRPKLTPSLDDRTAFLKCITPACKSPERTSQPASSSSPSLALDHISKAKAFFMSSIPTLFRNSPLERCQALYRGLLNNCKLLRFETDGDLWTVYERLAFRQHSFRYMHNPAPGVQCAEADLVKNFLLSFFPNECEGISAYRKLWVPLERQVVRVVGSNILPDQTKSARELPVGNRLDLFLAAYLTHEQNAEKKDILEQEDEEDQVEDFKRPPKRNRVATGSQKKNYGGAVHFMQGAFPTYLKLRSHVEDKLVRQGVDVTAWQGTANGITTMEKETREKKQKRAAGVVRAMMESMLAFAKKDTWCHSGTPDS
uniref:GmrSD restriction endonucleases N-terminal domain-containing protein n=1 Tax=Lotharella oceanica TaxID=641309 RepID=A0A7S2X7N6_9EUKA|eukprot:CAMPEP_0170171042 /NCGR_PEP_ID=MMETSP0040_2-20121228/4110_1 /TAXON_ID=641309 /ORGANISM="Lotharella oceanica, Strain CCMP622" /LENGTH=456 /DNA_ID=CAMNT_0010410837 /DNA_START=51 /DNA_END=1421 /DNA_ORIENTATION=-